MKKQISMFFIVLLFVSFYPALIAPSASAATNTTFATAAPIVGTSVTDTIQNQYDSLYYSFSAVEGNIKFSLTVPVDADFELYVYDATISDYSIADSIQTGVGIDEFIDLDISPGMDFVIQVYSWIGTGTFTLTINNTGTVTTPVPTVVTPEKNFTSTFDQVGSYQHFSMDVSNQTGTYTFKLEMPSGTLFNFTLYDEKDKLLNTSSVVNGQSVADVNVTIVSELKITVYAQQGTGSYTVSNEEKVSLSLPGDKFLHIGLNSGNIVPTKPKETWYAYTNKFDGYVSLEYETDTDRSLTIEVYEVYSNLTESNHLLGYLNVQSYYTNIVSFDVSSVFAMRVDIKAFEYDQFEGYTITMKTGDLMRKSTEIELETDILDYYHQSEELRELTPGTLNILFTNVQFECMLDYVLEALSAHYQFNYKFIDTTATNITIAEGDVIINNDVMYTISVPIFEGHNYVLIIDFSETNPNLDLLIMRSEFQSPFNTGGDNSDIFIYHEEFYDTYFEISFSSNLTNYVIYQKVDGKIEETYTNGGGKIVMNVTDSVDIILIFNNTNSEIGVFSIDVIKVRHAETERSDFKLPLIPLLVGAPVYIAIRKKKNNLKVYNSFNLK